MRGFLLPVLLVLLSGCASSDDVLPEGPLGPGMKTVTSKESPTTLTALDGTICNVMPWKFEATKVGDEVWCDWRSRSEGPQRGGA